VWENGTDKYAVTCKSHEKGDQTERGHESKGAKVLEVEIRLDAYDL